MKINISSMQMCDFYKNITSETGASFIFNSLKSIAKDIAMGVNPLLSISHGFRKGTEYARNALIQTTITYILSLMNVKSSINYMASILITTYFAGSRNGFRFGIKNSIFGLLLSFMMRCF